MKRKKKIEGQKRKRVSKKAGKKKQRRDKKGNFISIINKLMSKKDNLDGIKKFNSKIFEDKNEKSFASKIKNILLDLYECKSQNQKLKDGIFKEAQEKAKYLKIIKEKGLVKKETIYVPELEDLLQNSNMNTLMSHVLYLKVSQDKYKKEYPEIGFLEMLKVFDGFLNYLKERGFTMIGRVGEIVGYNPEIHEDISDSHLTGTMVKIEKVGWKRGDKIIVKATVNKVN